LALACAKLVKAGELKRSPLLAPIAAVSVGIVSGQHMLDLAYDEDSKAAVDFNVVMLGGSHLGELVEVQGTAEGAPFSRADINTLLDMAEHGLQELFIAQQEALS
jgi:ribonuclease PH